MFQKILISALVFAAIGCASQPGNYSASSGTPTVVPAPAGPQEHFLGPNDRNPAGEPRLYWRSASKTYDVKSGGLSVTDEYVVQQIMEWETRIPVIRTRMVPGWVIENDAICEGYQCSNAAGGKSEAWNAFFSAPKDQKDDRLADAIKGVGQATAKKLLAAGFFRSKPRSWQAFVEEIDKAVATGVIEKGIRYQIVVQYRYENMVNLGYNASDCQTVTYRCEKVVWGLVPEQYQDVEIRTDSRVEQQRVRKINFTVREPKLQAFETERIGLTVGEGAQDIQISSSGYTKYSAPRVTQSSSDTNVEIVGEERIPVDLPSEAYAGNDFKVLNGKPTLSVRVNPKYIGQGSQTDSLVVTYFVQTCKLSRWLPGCGTNSWVNSDMKFNAIRSSETQIEIPIEKGFKSQVKFRISRKNSQWYNDKPLFEVESDEVTVK